MNKTLFLSLLASIGVAAIMVSGVQYLTPVDLVGKQTNWTEKHVDKYLKEHDQINTVVKTNRQIIIKSDSELDDMLIVYTGDKSPICIKEQEFVSRTGISLTIVNPNRIKKFITQY